MVIHQIFMIRDLRPVTYDLYGPAHKDYSLQISAEL